MWFKKRKSRPTTPEVARRLVILKYVVAYALTAPPRDLLAQLLDQWGADEAKKFADEAKTERDRFWRGIRDAGLWQHLSLREREYAESTLVTMTLQQQVDASWRMEAAQTLMWSLSLLAQLPPYDTIASHDLLKTIPSGDFSAFIRSARLREQAEVERAREVAELWHWRSRTRQLIEQGQVLQADEKMQAAGFHSFDDIVRFSADKASEEGTIPPCIDQDFPAMCKAYRELTATEWSEVRSITEERHFAINWLCGYAPSNRWDDTPTET